MSTAPALVWFRQDLRLADNPALRAAIASKRPLILLFAFDDETPGPWRIGGASRWWLHNSLEALSADIEKRGGALVLQRGAAAEVIQRLCRDHKVEAVFWNRCYEPFAIERDRKLKEALGQSDVKVETFNGALLHEPWTVKTKTGEPYKVFTPFWRACQQLGAVRAPEPAPRKLACVAGVKSEPLAALDLLPKRPNWAAGFAPEWRPGERGAHDALRIFIDERLGAYPEARDQLGVAGTSRLSPHLHWGEISPVQIAAVVESACLDKPALRRSADKFMSELGWREFSTHILFHWPTLPAENWRAQFDGFAWRNDAETAEAWKRGRTGYPVVDAAMRELWTTGYMHNRARMIAASFLIKHLLIDWRVGEDWFWDTLVDADLANNAASWQWVAGSGADASPYFRIFNPVAQGERYDADGAYVRRWVPELAKLPDAYLHRPWDAPGDVLSTAGVVLGETYPAPLVEHSAARARALEAYRAL